MNANQLVTKERLVEELFADRPSASAVGALRVAVSRLRQALDAEGVLETQPGGYVLRVASDRLDAAEFEALHRRGRELMAAGCPADAAAALRQALLLWRGSPLADVALVEGVQGEIRRLDELRLSAVMDRVDADLALGVELELVAELEALIEAEPFQERLRAQLMHALYRAGAPGRRVGRVPADERASARRARPRAEPCAT